MEIILWDNIYNIYNIYINEIYIITDTPVNYKCIPSLVFFGGAFDSRAIPALEARDFMYR